MRTNFIFNRNKFQKNILWSVFLTISFIWTSDLIGQEPVMVVNGNKIDRKNFDDEVIAIMNDVGVPGMSLAIIDDNQIVHSRGYGYKDVNNGEKVDEETIFEACSLSKSFLVFIVHSLVDNGQLDLERPIHKYLKHEGLEYDPRYKLITSRMILNHTSGLENWINFNDETKLEILYEPGEKYNYSGEGYDYLSKVIAKILGKSIESYYKDILFDPLGLTRTFCKFSKDGNFPGNYAIGHSREGEKLEKWKNLEPDPASGTSTLSKDFAKLMIATFNGKYLSERRIKDILDPQIKLTEDDPDTSWGGGYALLVQNDDTIAFQGGNNAGFKCFAYYSVNKKDGLVFFTNSDLGYLVLDRLNQMSVNLNIKSIVSSFN